jgi:hypothetical protein
MKNPSFSAVRRPGGAFDYYGYYESKQSPVFSDFPLTSSGRECMMNLYRGEWSDESPRRLLGKAALSVVR